MLSSWTGGDASVAPDVPTRFTGDLHLDAIPNFEKGAGGLLPVIAQDCESDRVLMMAWMNRQAWEETLASGDAVYFSRSRGKLWRKGETSGHRQRVVEIRVDCDADTILLRVQQSGAACHQGYQSCFFRSVDFDGKIDIVDQRMVDPNQVYGDQQPGNEKSGQFE